MSLLEFLKGTKKAIKEVKEPVLEAKPIVLTKEEIIARELGNMKLKLNRMELKHDLDNSMWHDLCEGIYSLCIKYNFEHEYATILNDFLSVSQTRISIGSTDKKIYFSNVINYLEVLSVYGISLDDIGNLRNSLNSANSVSKTK